MYDFPNSTDIFEIFEVGLANSHILVTNHLDTPKLPIFEQWRLDMGYLSYKNLLRQDDKEDFFVATKTTKTTKISRQYSGS